MKVAIPVWDGQVSPVFDVARRVEVYDLIERRVSRVSTRRLHSGQTAADLEADGVEVLICAAISTEAEAAMRIAGINLISEVCGPVDTIVAAFAQGDHALEAFRSPAARFRHGSRRQATAARHHPAHPRR